LVDQIENPTLQALTANQLLTHAQTLYDDPASPFAASARQEAWKSGFVSGAAWMRLVMEHLRGTKLALVTADFQQLGVIKYTLCATGALLWVFLSIVTGLWILSPFAIVAFYAIETQMVFLFPLALDGYTAYYRESLRWTQKAGGTLHVMLIVMRLAVVMLFGGLLGGGFIRSWSLGCLSVVLWYEQVRQYA
jgi:hypothetical protein